MHSIHLVLHQGTHKVCDSDGQRRVLASDKDFGDHSWRHSAEKLSKQAVEECSRLTQMTHSIHLVLQSLDCGWMLSVVSPNFSRRLGWAKKKTERRLTTPIMLHTFTLDWSHNCHIQRVGSTMCVLGKRIDILAAIPFVLSNILYC